MTEMNYVAYMAWVDLVEDVAKKVNKIPSALRLLRLAFDCTDAFSIAIDNSYEE